MRHLYSLLLIVLNDLLQCAKGNEWHIVFGFGLLTTFGADYTSISTAGNLALRYGPAVGLTVSTANKYYWLTSTESLWIAPGRGRVLSGIGFTPQ